MKKGLEGSRTSEHPVLHATQFRVEGDMGLVCSVGMCVSSVLGGVVLLHRSWRQSEAANFIVAGGSGAGCHPRGTTGGQVSLGSLWDAEGGASSYTKHQGLIQGSKHRDGETNRDGFPVASMTSAFGASIAQGSQRWPTGGVPDRCSSLEDTETGRGATTQPAT